MSKSTGKNGSSGKGNGAAGSGGKTGARHGGSSPTPNLPSKTGKPSGPGRGNNPPKK